MVELRNPTPTLKMREAEGPVHECTLYSSPARSGISACGGGPWDSAAFFCGLQKLVLQSTVSPSGSLQLVGRAQEEAGVLLLSESMGGVVQPG